MKQISMNTGKIAVNIESAGIGKQGLWTDTEIKALCVCVCVIVRLTS